MAWCRGVAASFRPCQQRGSVFALFSFLLATSTLCQVGANHQTHFLSKLWLTGNRRHGEFSKMFCFWITCKYVQRKIKFSSFFKTKRSGNTHGWFHNKCLSWFRNQSVLLINVRRITLMSIIRIIGIPLEGYFWTMSALQNYYPGKSS